MTPTLATTPTEDAPGSSCRVVLDLLALDPAACNGTHHGPDDLLDTAPAAASARPELP